MAEKLLGTWKLVNTVNFDNFLQEMGTAAPQRNVVQSHDTIMDIRREGDTFFFNATIGPTTQANQMTVGSDSEFAPPGGRRYKGPVKLEGKRLIAKGRPMDGSSEKEFTLIREVTEAGELFQTMYIGDVICTRTFTRLS